MATAMSDTSPRWSARARSVSLPLAILGGLILARLALAGWWLAVDHSVFDTESSRHLQNVWNGNWAITAGDTFAFFKASTEYPPLLYLLSSLGALVAGLSIDSLVGAQDLFLIPALAVGCYGAATIAYGRMAGVLAAVFALGAPMAVSAFHMYLIDTTELATTALAIWAVLATDRFAHTGRSALAGVALGLGMLSKQNFPLFVLGLIAVVLLRGGWRHWRGLLACVVIAAAISATWYWSEIDRTLDLIRGASASASGTAGAVSPTADRWTAKNLGYYAWSTVNVIVLFPFTAAAVGGAIALLVRFVRTRARSDHTPELIVGAIFSYAALTWISLKDPRYALPMLPYLAILGTGWIPLLRGRVRTGAAAAIGAVALLNVIMTIWGTGAIGKLFIPGAPGNSQGRQLTFWLPQGWVAGRPETSSAIVDVMRAAKADGLQGIAFDPGANQSRFNQTGLDILSREAGVPLSFPYDPSNRRAAVLSNRNPPLADEKPCGMLSEGTGIYLTKGPVEIPFEQRRFYRPPGCPNR